MLTDEYRYRILKLLENNPTASQREIARELGVSLGRVNYCLQALVEKGLIKVNNFRRNESKRAYLYFLTPKGMKEKARVTVRFLKVETRRIRKSEARGGGASARGGRGWPVKADSKWQVTPTRS